jgi:hypothetical protein
MTNNHEFALNQQAIAHSALTNVEIQRDEALQRRLQNAYIYWSREVDNTQPDTQWEQTRQQIINLIAANPDRWQQISDILATLQPQEPTQ